MSDEFNKAEFLKEIVEIGKFSLREEEKRNESILAQSSRLWTANAFVSASLIGIVNLAYLNGLRTNILFLSGVTLSVVFLISSIFFLNLSHCYHKRERISNAWELRTEFKEHLIEYKTPEGFPNKWIELISRIHKGIEKEADKRKCFLTASVIFFSLSSTLIFIILILILWSAF